MSLFPQITCGSRGWFLHLRRLEPGDWLEMRLPGDVWIPVQFDLERPSQLTPERDVLRVPLGREWEKRFEARHDGSQWRVWDRRYQRWCLADFHDRVTEFYTKEIERHHNVFVGVPNVIGDDYTQVRADEAVEIAMEQASPEEQIEGHMRELPPPWPAYPELSTQDGWSDHADAEDAATWLQRTREPIRLTRIAHAHEMELRWPKPGAIAHHMLCSSYVIDDRYVDSHLELLIGEE